MGWMQRVMTASERQLRQLSPQMATAAQAVYDNWEQDAEGMDWELGGGGICDRISDAIAQVIPFETQAGGQDGDDHSWLVVKTPDGYYGVDIPPRKYETGGGYSWKKIPGVVFGPSDIEITHLGTDDAYWAPE